MIVGAGAEWNPGDYGLETVAHNLGVLDYRTTGALYRACDAGVVLMMTRHMSYLPLELMACGSLVITNSNPDTAWLLKDSENCLLSDLSPTGIADTIEAGLRDSASRRRITAAASEMVAGRFSRWDEQIEKIYQYLLRVC